MTAREYLEQYQEAVRRANRYRVEYEEERILIDAVRSVSDNDGMPHGNGISKPTEKKAMRLADKAAKWKEAEIDALAIRQEIFETVMKVGGIEADVLVEKFIYLKTWEEVCEAVHYSWESVRLAWHRGEDKLEYILSVKH